MIKRKLSAIWDLIRCKNYLLVTYKDNNLLYDHTMHENDVVKYSKRIINHYETLQAGQEITLLEAKDILGL